jgi:hypothetical protein
MGLPSESQYRKLGIFQNCGKSNAGGREVRFGRLQESRRCTWKAGVAAMRIGGGVSASIQWLQPCPDPRVPGPEPPLKECGASEFRATRFHSQCHAELVSASIRGWKPCLDSLILDPETSSGRRDVTHSVMPNSFRHLFKACNLALNHLLQVLKQVQDDSNLPYRIRPACDGRSWRRTHHQGSCRGSDLHLRGLLGWHSHSTHLSRIIFFVSMNPPA